jgi:hypothetical protein
MKAALTLFLAVTLPMGFVSAEDGARLVWQPVLEYMVREPTVATISKNGTANKLTLNPFIAYTHLGTDFGFHGPGERFITWHDHQVCLALDTPSDWAGMWHSLAGLASASNEVLDFSRCYPDLILPEAQPSVASLQLRAMGKGKLKLEIKDSAQALLWTGSLDIDQADARPAELALSPPTLKRAKFLNWTAEPGSDLCLTRLSMGVQVPAMEFDRYVVLASYAKFARCYTHGMGLIKDRAHIPTGTFDSVPASGLFALATAMASRPEVGIVSHETAEKVLHEIHDQVARIPTGLGLLPHFSKRVNGKSVIHPGTEFSTVDTSICLHGLLLAAEMLGDVEIKTQVLGAIHRIDFNKLVLNDGALSHGLKDDGRTVIPFAWRDWGGETALVMLLQRLAGSEPSPNSMNHTGHPWQGTGFIAEVQSLFYPDFDSTTPDAVSKTNWHEARRALLTAQQAYYPKAQPQSRAAQLGYFGLSAGEGAYGTSYEVGGTDLSNQKLVHPHYMLMSALMEDDPKLVYRVLDRMEHDGYLTPWGLVENISADGSRYLPMISALNAAFESIGAYHLLTKTRGINDAIYEASRNSPELRDAMKLFYPASVATR